MGRALDVHAWPLSLGRALDNDLVIDDPHVAPQHAQLLLDEAGTLHVVVGDSINGLRWGAQQLGAGQSLALPPGGGELQLGPLRLRVRLPAEALAPEKPLPQRHRAAGLLAAGSAALVLLMAVADHWVAQDPGADAAAWLPLLLGLPLAAAAWAGLWALASKLFQHRFDFVGHLRIVLPWLLAIELMDTLLPPLAAAMGWPGLWRLAPPLQAVMGLLLVREHLLHVLPQSRRAVTALALSGALAGTAISVTLSLRATDRISRPPYMSLLPLPMLRLDQPVPPATLVQDLAPLAAQLARRVEKAKADEPTDDAETAGD